MQYSIEAVCPTVLHYTWCLSLNVSILGASIHVGSGDTAVERLVVEDAGQRKRIISSIHDTSHLGVNRTHDMVACKYYWPGQSNDIRAYVSVVILII